MKAIRILALAIVLLVLVVGLALQVGVVGIKVDLPPASATRPMESGDWLWVLAWLGGALAILAVLAVLLIAGVDLVRRCLRRLLRR